MPEDALSRKLVDFGVLQIEYDERVLVPRPWTVLQSHLAAALLPGLPAGEVLELCAGPGHIGLLATTASDRHLVQVDADAVACAFARRNADHAGRGDRVEIRHGFMEDALDPTERFALVIADPPWVRSDDVALHPDDPPWAIDGGPDGLDLVRTCLDVIARHLLPCGAAVLQVGDPDQVGAVAEHIAGRLPGLRMEEHRVAEGGAVVRLASNPA